MSVKTLPLRGPVTRFYPRRRTRAERLMSALELAALTRAVSRARSRRRSPRIPRRVVFISLAGGGAAAAAAALAGRRSSAAFEPPASVAPGAVSGNGAGTMAETPTAPGSDEEAEKLDVDAPNESAPGHDVPGPSTEGDEQPAPESEEGQ